jgi:hypothetical protein
VEESRLVVVVVMIMILVQTNKKTNDNMFFFRISVTRFGDNVSELFVFF